MSPCMQEMHQHIPTRNTTHHRKTTVSFRDLCLLDVFGTSLEALRYLKGGSDTTVQKQVRPHSHPSSSPAPRSTSSTHDFSQMPAGPGCSRGSGPAAASAPDGMRQPIRRPASSFMLTRSPSTSCVWFTADLEPAPASRSRAPPVPLACRSHATMPNLNAAAAYPPVRLSIRPHGHWSVLSTHA